jgi:hypothetical protein
VTTFDELNAEGLAERGDLFGDVQQKVVEPIEAPRLEGGLPFPEPGIYFSMPEDVYHAIHAVSFSGLKRLSVSSMNYWADSLLNPDREERETKFFDFGKAIHCLVLEGEECYAARYAVDLDLADFEGQPILVSTDDIKNAIGKHFETVPVKPQGKTKQDFIDQLADLGEKHGEPVALDGDVPTLKARIGEFKEPQPVKPVSRVTEVREDGSEWQRPAVKDDLANQLLALDPDALVWEKMLAAHREANPGKQFIDAKTERRVRIASRMILAHPEITQAVKGGYPEVSIFYYCPETGVPVKVRMDYLKMRMVVDLKSFNNSAEKPIDRAIEQAIASRKYNMQHALYEEAVMQARKMVREMGCDAINLPLDIENATGLAMQNWCLKWANQMDPPAWLFIFQQTGTAPVTRGKLMPRGTVFSVTRSRITALKREWAECAKTFGTDPWVDVVPIDEIEDEAIPLYATEIGKVRQ